MYYEDLNQALLRIWNHRRGLRVLDVGCGYASTSQYIQQEGNEVTGIELNPDSVKLAAQRISRVIPHDCVEFDALREKMKGEQFDVILFADVLEHLVDPQAVLRFYLTFLKDGGSVIVSLPNVALWSVRLQLMAGMLNYADSGVLDRTHLRFFTRSSAKQLLRDAGLEPIKTAYNPGLARPFVPLVKKMLAGKEKADDPRAILDSPANKLYMKVIEPVERAVMHLRPTLMAFQMVFEARNNKPASLAGGRGTSRSSAAAGSLQE